MIWRQDTTIIYAIVKVDRFTGFSTFDVYPDTWDSSQPDVHPDCAGMTPPPSREIPIRGFGKVWCENQLWDEMAYAMGPEEGVTLTIQETAVGIYVAASGDGVFILDLSKGTAWAP